MGNDGQRGVKANVMDANGGFCLEWPSGALKTETRELLVY